MTISSTVKSNSPIRSCATTAMRRAACRAETFQTSSPR